MIEPVTSIADLVFKAKSNNLYLEVLILVIKSFGNRTDTIKEYEHAVRVLNEYTQGWTDCSVLVDTANRQCRYVGRPSLNIYEEMAKRHDDLRNSFAGVVYQQPREIVERNDNFVNFRYEQTHRGRNYTAQRSTNTSIYDSMSDLARQDLVNSIRRQVEEEIDRSIMRNSNLWNA